MGSVGERGVNYLARECSSDSVGQSIRRKCFSDQTSIKLFWSGVLTCWGTGEACKGCGRVWARMCAVRLAQNAASVALPSLSSATVTRVYWV